MVCYVYSIQKTLSKKTYLQIAVIYDRIITTGSDYMENTCSFKVIAHIYNDFRTKFGIPRQSGLDEGTGESIIVFEPEYRDENALRGIEEYSHLWLIWHFSQAKCDKWHPTVRPPRLGGNKRVGVFATRSPFRPNPVGLSSVKLIEVKKTKEHGTVLKVRGSDLMDGTPIFDIKPYLSFTDSHPEAKNGFADGVLSKSIDVVFEKNFTLTQKQKEELTSLLSQDPRPSYQEDEKRIYGMAYAHMNVKFRVKEGVLYVTEIE